MATDRVEAVFRRFRERGAAQGQMPGREEGSRNSEDKQEQGKGSQQLVLPAQGGIIEDTPASSMELDLPRVRGAHVECGGVGSSGTAKNRKKKRPHWRTCEWKWDKGPLGKEAKEKKTARERTPVERWRVQKKRKEKKWKKEKKKKKRRKT